MHKKYTVRGISFELPADWIVRELDDLLEAVDSEDTGALHMSFLIRSNAAMPTQDDASSLVTNFAENNNLTCQADVAVTLGKNEIRALARCRSSYSSPGEVTYWLVGSVVWPDSAVRISYCTDRLDKTREVVAEAIIASIRRNA